MESYYEILGVTKDATTDQIKSAYRNLAFKYHPDKNPNDKNAEQIFKNINHAYSILSNPDSRRKYDQNNTEYEDNNEYSNEQALYQFMNTMYAYASEMTMRNISSDKISAFLVEKGCPASIAQSIAVSIEMQRKAMIRKAAGGQFIKSIFAIIAGFLFTAISYNMGGSRYFVFYGLMIYGLWNGLKALYYIATGRVPQQK